MEVNQTDEQPTTLPDITKKAAEDPNHIEVDTDCGGHIVITITPKKKFDKQQQFAVHYVGPDGKEEDGVFIVKRLNLGEQAQVGVNKARLAQSLQVDANTDSTLQMLAHLQQCLVDKPDWFKPTEAFDDDLIIAVYRRCLAFEASFRKSLPQ